MGKGWNWWKYTFKIAWENQLLESPSIIYNKWHLIKKSDVKNSHHDLDRIMAKWLAAFMDEGLAEWKCLIKPRFYNASQTSCIWYWYAQMTISEIQSGARKTQ
jgi:hypothetical protein